MLTQVYIELTAGGFPVMGGHLMIVRVVIPSTCDHFKLPLISKLYCFCWVHKCNFTFCRLMMIIPILTVNTQIFKHQGNSNVRQKLLFIELSNSMIFQ